jgi:hypothetical protein
MSPREIRLLRCLIKGDRVFIRDLRELIGAQNPAQIKFSLKKQGWAIQVDFIETRDRDDKTCRSGCYWMDLAEKERATRFLEDAKQAAATARSAKDKTSFGINSLSDGNSITGGK